MANFPPSTSVGLAPWSTPVLWASGVNYVAGPPASAIYNAAGTYVATAAHTSGAAFATDLAAGKWVLALPAGPAGGNVGQTPAIDSTFTVASLRDSAGGFLGGPAYDGRDIRPRYSRAPSLGTFTDAYGFTQIRLGDHVAGAARLTGTANGGGGANNWGPVYVQGGKIRFFSDRRGIDEQWLMNEDGTGQAPVTSLFLMHWLFYGQSLSLGTNTGVANAGSALTTTNAEPGSYMLTTNGGVAPYGPRPNNDDTNGTAVTARVQNPLTVHGMELLKEAVPATGARALNMGETPCSGFAAQFALTTALARAFDPAIRRGFSCDGLGSSPWFQPTGSSSPTAEIGPRSYPFVNAMMSAAEFRRSVEALGGGYAFAGMVMLHGEADATNLSGSGVPTTYAQYKLDMISCMKEFNEKMPVDSRLHRDRRMYQKQLSALYYGPGAFDIARAQADVSLDCRNIVSVGPAYHLTYNADATHFTAAGSRQWGELAGKWARRIEREGRPAVTFALYKAVLVDSTHILVTINQPANTTSGIPRGIPWGGSLVVDTTNITAVADGNLGLKLYDSSGATPTISGVTVTADGMGLMLALSGALQPPSAGFSPYVTAGDTTTGTSGKTGPTQGARTNIRTQETEVGVLSGAVLYDYLGHSQVGVTLS